MATAIGIRALPVCATALAFGLALGSHVASAQAADTWRFHAAESDRDAMTVPAAGTNRDVSRTDAPEQEESTARTRSEVDAIVAERNGEASREAQAFVSEGWTFVEAPEPDPLLVSSSPALLPQREAELSVQLASAPPGPEYLENVVQVAAGGRELRTRIAAVEAIARMGDGRPQRALLELLNRMPPDDDARRVVVSRLRPSGSEGPTALAMAALLDSPYVSRAEKEQLAWTLALVSLGEGASLPPTWYFAASPRARALVERAYVLARRSPDGRE